MLKAVVDGYNTIKRMNFLQVRAAASAAFRLIFQLSLQVLNFVGVVTTAFMMWKALSVVTNNESPIVVVLRYRRRSSKVSR